MTIAALMLLLLPAAAAHEGLDLQIARATQEIEEQPGRADLHLQRGELHRLHEDWVAAKADFDRAARLDPSLSGIDLARARMWLAFGDAREARNCVDRFLARMPDHAEGLLERGRAQARLGRPKEAAEDFTRALARMEAPRPEVYLERAAAQRAAGSPEEALRGLDEGLRKLGALVTLSLPAIELDLELRRFDSALERVEEIEARSERKDPWLARRGEILRQAGRPEEARQAYRAALVALEALPAARREAPFTRELERKVRTSLEVLDAKP